jgi:hypothetical protein
VEFLFTLQSPGPLALDPFEILAPGRAGSSGEITLQVRSRRNPGQYNPSFHWENVPPFLRLGEQGELTLALSNWDPRLPPPENFFQGRPPLNCLLEPLGGQDRGIYRLRIIPLEGDRAALEPWTFVHEGYTLRVPGLSIPFKKAEVLEVSPDPGEGIFPAVSLSPDSGEKPVPKAGALFPGAALIPAGRAAVFFPFRGFYDRAVERARNLWLENKAPEALAELRRAEASALTGSTLIPLRRELEENLGLGPTPDERWDPLGGLTGVLPGLLLGVLCLLGGARRVPARIQGFRRSRKTAQGIAAVSCPSIRTRMEGEIQAESPVPTTAHAVVGHAPIELLSFESLESIQATGGSGNLSPGEHPVTGGGRFIPPARKKGVTSFWGNGYKTIASLVLVLVGLGLIIFSLGKAPGNFRGRGVMKGAAVFRIPDSGGAAAAWFEEGQPVFIRSPAGNWIYAESPDGRGGWVPRDAVADY